MNKNNFLHQIEMSVRALRLGAVTEAQFMSCVHNAVMKYLALAWMGTGASHESRDLLRIQHEALSNIDQFTTDAKEADDGGLVRLMGRFGWWYDHAVMTGFRVAALDGVVANEQVYYYGRDFRITEGDVDEAVREAEEMVGPGWAALMEAEPWEEETE